jgi:hypothetical protein
MPSPPIKLDELALAVQNAVQQTLAKHGAVPINQLWVGFVAPETLATLDSATKVATTLARETGAIGATGSIAQLGAAPGAAGEHLPVKPGHLIGLIYKPQFKPQ